MSTRSTIAVKFPNGAVKAVYCHFDGYPEGVGATLSEHYNTQKKAETVVSLGDLSVLDESMECPAGHSFRSRAAGHSVAYGRDRGEQDVDADTFDTVREFRAQGNKQQFTYLWNGNEWETTREAF